MGEESAYLARAIFSKAPELHAWTEKERVQLTRWRSIESSADASRCEPHRESLFEIRWVTDGTREALAEKEQTTF